MHFALQLHWIVAAAMEDYAPEDPGGAPNARAHARYFMRCAHLDANVERCARAARSRVGLFARLSLARARLASRARAAFPALDPGFLLTRRRARARRDFCSRRATRG